MYQRTPILLVASLLLGSLCGCEEYHLCLPPEAAPRANLPDLLSDTELFREVRPEQLGPGVRAYSPKFELWSDGASKRRWIRIPEGSLVDTEDMDSWRFPTGTQVWKEFTRDGVRVETRMIKKVGDEAWEMGSYLWNTAGTDAELRIFGVVHARGTSHNVPAASECVGCHDAARSQVLGFSAVQLDAVGDFADILTTTPEAPSRVPGNVREQEVLGYLHANCGHCHNPDRARTEGSRCYDSESDLDLTLSVHASRLQDTGLYRTAVGNVVVAGHPEQSDLLGRMSNRAYYDAMPPVGTLDVDRAAVGRVEEWIRSLP